MPLLFFSKYWDYKVRNRKFLNWLLGTIYELDRNLLSAFPGAKDAFLEEADYQSVDYVTARPLPPHGYVRLAKRIVEKKGNITVKKLQMIRDIIEDRKRTAQRWRNSYLQSENLVRRNNEHKYFITVLEKTLSILESGSASSIAGPGLGTSSGVDTNSWSDKVKDLSALEETEQLVEALTGTDLYDETLETSDDGENEAVEALIALHFFFELLEEMRAYLKEVWTIYSRRETSLVCASMTTSIAFETIRLEESKMIARFPQWSSYTAIAECLTGDSEPSSTLPYNDVFQMLRLCTIGNGINNGLDFEQLTKEMWNGLILGRNSALKISFSNEGAWHLLQILLELCCYHVSHNKKELKLPEYDALTKGIFRMLEYKIVLTSVVFACQIYKDIRMILGAEQPWFEAEFKPFVKDMSHSMAAFFQKFDSLGSLADGRMRLQTLTVDEYRTFWRKFPSLGAEVNNVIQNFSSTCTNREKTSIFPPICSQNLFRIQPLLCGQLMFRFASRYHGLGILFQNGTWDAMALAHLYNAGRLSKHVKKTWTDIETILTFHRSGHFLLPDTNDAFLLARRCVIASGGKAENYASNNGSLDIDVDRARMRKLATVPLIEVMRAEGDTLENSESPARDLDSIQQILLKIREISPELESPPSHKKNKKRRQEPSGLDFVRLFQRRLQEVELQLYFDYFSFWRRIADVPRQALSNNDWSLGEDVLGCYWNAQACAGSVRWFPVVMKVLLANQGVEGRYEARRYPQYCKALEKLCEMLVRELDDKESAETERAMRRACAL